ncbi:hypothetical protein [Tessaracoccus sp. Z1128]
MSDQLTHADLATMTPQQIEAARQRGRFDALLGVATPDEIAARDLVDTGGTLDRHAIQTLHAARQYEAIDRARLEGRISYQNGN